MSKPAVQKVTAAVSQSMRGSSSPRTAIQAAPRSGLALARMAGMLTYRTPGEIERRFRPTAPGTHPVRDYLEHLYRMKDWREMGRLVRVLELAVKKCLRVQWGRSKSVMTSPQ